MHELQALLLYISNLLTYLLTDLLPHVRLTTYSRELQAFVRSCVAASQARCEREGAPPPELISFLFTPDKVWGVRQILSSTSFDQAPSERRAS
jgi:hypothetical protein